MEENSTTGLELGPSLNERDLIGEIHRKLAGLDMPCTCKEELDRTIVAIETWQRMKARRELVNAIREDYRHLVSGVGFLTDLAEVDRLKLTREELLDHAESLKFLADLADRCADRLNGLAQVPDADR